MDDRQAEVIELVRKAALEMRRRFDVRAVYLFGSHVKGTAHHWSDIDVGIFLSEFKTAPYHVRIQAIVDVQRDLSDDLEFHFFDESNPATQESVSFAAHVRKTGVRVA